MILNIALSLKGVWLRHTHYPESEPNPVYIINALLQSGDCYAATFWMGGRPFAISVSIGYWIAAALMKRLV